MLPWLLDQLKQNQQSTGQRLLDIFTVHYYPQGGESSDDVSSAMQLCRNRSTRSLWDPNYIDETWINDKVQLIPRLKTWVNTYYPNTPTGITEYNWGAEGHINGATTQADILGIFGRENLDMATRWTRPDPATPTYKAIKMYRNYDGNKSAFGETSVAASVPNPDNLSSFAAVRSSDGALTVMVVSKYLTGNTATNINLANFAASGKAEVWQLTSANAISRQTDVNFSGNSLNITVPAQSVTLLVILPSRGNQPPVASAVASPTSGPAPLLVNFNGSGSSDPDGTISSYAWDFGDGSSASGSSVSHTYNTPGNYMARLTVTDDRGATSSATVSVTVNANTPAAPTNLTASVSSSTQINLSWSDNAANESGFKIERCIGSGCTSFTQIATVSANIRTYANTGLNRNTTYTYRVRAYNAAGNSAYTNTAAAKTLRR